MKTSPKTALDVLLLACAALSFILLSPKWTVGLAAWIAPALLLTFFRRNSLRPGLIGAFGTLLLANGIGQYNVVPMPLLFFAVFVLISSMLQLIPYLLDRWMISRLPPLAGSLVFPMAQVSLEFMNSWGGGGTWNSTAYTQYGFDPLMQLASITGLWGITFIVYWWASLLTTLILFHPRTSVVKRGVAVYASVLGMVLLYGSLRPFILDSSTATSVRIAGVSVENITFLERLYQCHFGEPITIPPTVSQTSPELQRANQALLPFIENPRDPKWQPAYITLDSIYDQLFALSHREAEAGAQLLLWSEANALVTQGNERTLIARGQQLAQQHHVYLLMTLAIILPGKTTSQRKFLENLAVLIDPSGTVVNTYHKNRPVPFAESSVPGDGTIPTITTPFGRISPIICYDADFPDLLRQTGRSRTDILLVPSGDWAAIAPYHSYMAVFRGIENGCSVVRMVSHGTSMATNPAGETVALTDYFQAGEKVLVAQIPTQGVTTLYPYLGDGFAYLCIFSLIVLIVAKKLLLYNRKKFFKKIYSFDYLRKNNIV